MKKTATALTLLMLLGACKSDVGSHQYQANDVGVVNRAFKCRVLSVREIEIKNNMAGGALAGGAGGALAGTAVGGSDAGTAVAVVAGAVIGGTVGALASDELSKQQGYEYIVEKEDGELAVLAQGEIAPMSIGQRCIIMYGSRKNRVVPFPEEVKKPVAKSTKK